MILQSLIFLIGFLITVSLQFEQEISNYYNYSNIYGIANDTPIFTLSNFRKSIFGLFDSNYSASKIEDTFDSANFNNPIKDMESISSLWIIFLWLMLLFTIPFIIKAKKSFKLISFNFSQSQLPAIVEQPGKAPFKEFYKPANTSNTKIIHSAFPTSRKHSMADDSSCSSDTLVSKIPKRTRKDSFFE
eukprot:NODE_153_length_15389_cov_1.201439.p9 type:complete len:188 gc:universal NODE_153_length_15389_cov_1.201439:2214-2777(+)